MTFIRSVTGEVETGGQGRKYCHLRFFAGLLSALCSFYVSSAWSGIDPEFEKSLLHLAPYEEVSIIVTLKEMPRPQKYAVGDRSKRHGGLVRALKKHARASQIGINKYLKRKGLRKTRDLWHVNGMVLKLKASQVRALATQPGVVSVRRDSVVSFAAPLQVAASAMPEWNLSAVHLPELWAAGYTGTGIVVATMDTGVDITHSELSGKWRGGNNSWFDPHGEHEDPYDATGHGTQVMGLLVGGNSSGINIGAATDAKFIATKIFDDEGETTYSAIHAAFQWLLDPDHDPNTADTPDVVNASWGLPASNNKCNVEFDTDIRMLKAAGVAVVFAGGNDGPAPATGVSPASSAGFISTGAINSDFTVANFSSRGPSPCSGGIFPTLVAPGENIYTIDLNLDGLNSYTTVNGTSFAVPHVSGIIALLAGAFPSLSVNDLEAAVMQSTQDYGTPGPDNSYGSGLVNANKALKFLENRPSGKAPVITSTPPIVAMQGALYSYQITVNLAGDDSSTFKLETYPAGMNIDQSGLIVWVPGSAQVGQQLVVVRVKEGTGLSDTQSFVVVVANVNDAPVANEDFYTMSQATTLTVEAPGLLLNDTDRNANPLKVASFGAASTGSVVVNEDGSFIYKPPTNAFTGIATFSYQAGDGALSSASSIATINVQASAGGTLALPGIPPGNIENPPPPDPVIVQPDPLAGINVTEPVATTDFPAQASRQNEGNTLDITSAPSSDATQGVLFTYQIAARDEAGGALVYSLDVAPEGMTISNTGEISWIPNAAQVHKNTVVVRVANTDKVFATQSYTVAVKNTNDAPVAERDNYKMIQGSILTVAVPGVLSNDTDVDLNSLSAVNYSAASVGSLQGNLNGSFVYTPPTPRFTGPVTFTYKASDGELQSEAVKVTIDVLANHAPLAADDFVSAAVRKAGVAYAPVAIAVLSNDMDADTELDAANKIDPATLKIVNQPNQGGRVVVAPSGLIMYTPATNFTGVETFYYHVADVRQAKSNTVSVRINVK